ncbi:MAG TPA: PKD domain-containing protein [Chitinophagaceae bacterium]|nr:PKD domain-containing protein [Chitinophagaceae bacterium]
MKKNITLIITMFLILVSGCTKLEYDDVSFVEAAKAPDKLSAMFDITQDNTGLVTIYPNGEGVAYYNVTTGLPGANPVKVLPGKSLQATYPEGSYDVKIVGVGVNGKSAEITQKLTVSFKAPENVEVTTSVDPSSGFMINVTAKALYETVFKIYWGEDPNEVPVSFLEGETVSHVYSKSGDYTIKVVALSGGAQTTTVTKNITVNVPLVLPLDFETVGQTYTFSNFDGGDATVIDNPQKNTINTSSKVGKMVKNAGQPWGGSVIQLSSPIDFSVNKIMRMKVFSPRVGAKVLLKVENATDGTINFEKEVSTTVANQWEDLAFDYRTINTANAYSKVVLIFELGTMGDGTSNFTFLFDDIRQTNTIEELALPMNFESTTLDYEFVNFGGGTASVVDNPFKSGINTSNKTAKMVKNPPEGWGGSFIALENPIDFSTKKYLKVKVYSPRVGAKVLLKVENLTDGGIAYEKEAVTTTANAWEELTYDYTGINTANSYQKVVLIFDLGTPGDGSANYTWYFDDITQSEKPEELGIPLNFESTALAYDFTNFDGGNATVVDNPFKTGINASNKVGKMVKGPGGQPWGGSFITLANPIDFSAGKTFKVKVYSPRVGAKLLLKVENLTDGGINFEKEVATTVANGWEELSFDYNAINTANSYQKVVLIFDLGTVGDGTANYTFYFDDITLN